ncbi:MAG TPA: DinB family protein [Gemmataceae bacterium]|jgi:uncharacterized damage-inducible protein DinB|nr:DinB family protein [Gemmataceae bacterium]
MDNTPDLSDTILAAWRTNSRVTAYLVEHLPAKLWNEAIPEMPFRTVRTVAAHLHNSRVGWIRTLGREHGITVPAIVDRRRATRAQVVAGLRRSAKGIEALLRLGIAAGGQIPPTRAYVWRNLPLDVGHVLAYFAAHEGHHRGQLVLIARQLGQRLPQPVLNGLWQWTTRVREG